MTFRPFEKYSTGSGRIRIPTKITFSTESDAAESSLKIAPDHQENISILTKIRALDTDNHVIQYLDTPNYSEQIELIKDLYDRGYKQDAYTCLEIMEDSIARLKPNDELWFGMMCSAFAGYIYLGPVVEYNDKHNVHIISKSVRNNVVFIAFCEKGAENDPSPKEHHIAIFMQDLLVFAHKNQFNEVVSDLCDQGIATHKEFKVDLEPYVQDKMQPVIEDYLSSGNKYYSV